MDNKGIKYVVIGVVLVMIIAIVFLTVHIIIGTNKIDDNGNELEEISYTAPEDFEEYLGYNYVQYFYNSDNYAYCRLKVFPYDKETYDDRFKDAKEMLEKTTYAYLSQQVGKIEEIIINGKPGYFVKITSPEEIKYNYGIESSNYIYKIEYEIKDIINGDRSDIDTNKCFTTIDKFIDSIQVK